MIHALIHYLPLLLLTVALEAPVVRALAPRDQRRRAMLACLALNLFTHPVATLLLWRWNLNVFSLELLVLLFEWFGYCLLLQLRPLRGFSWALLANAASAIAGVAMWIARMR